MPETQQSVNQHRASSDNDWLAILPAALSRLATLRRWPVPAGHNTTPTLMADSAWRSLFAAHEATPKLSVLHRLAILYLMLPVLIWLLGWFHWWVGLPAALLLVLALWPVLAGPWRPSLPLLLFLVLLARIIASITGGLLDLNIAAWNGLPATALLAFALWRALIGPRRGRLSPVTMALLVMAAGWILLTAAGGVFDLYNADWPKHRALFFSLSNGSWPIHPPSYFSTPPILRYSLGYYVVPGLVGQWLGLAALNWAVPLWTWGGVVLMMLLFTRHYRSWQAMLAVVVLICFGGMDIIGFILFGGWDLSAVKTIFDSGGVIDGMWGSLNIGYNAKMTNLMWLPQHFIPASLYSLLLFQLHRQPRFLTVSGVLLAAGLFWSPFMALGLLPLVGVLLVENGLRPFLRWPNLLLAVPLAGLLGVYLASGTANLPQGWLWEFHGWETVAKGLPVFYLLEFMTLAGLLWLVRPQLRREPFFLISVVTLLLVPWYQMGIHGDFSRRVSLPALVMLCWYTADFLANHLFTFTRGQALRGLALVVLIVVLGADTVDPLVHVLRATLVTLCWCAAFLANHRFTRTGGQALHEALWGLAFIGLIVVLGIGTFNLFFQVARANNHHNLGGFHYEQHSVNYWLTLPPQLRSQYMTYDLPDWYLSLLRDNDTANTAIDKGDLVIHSDYDVYLDDDRVIYIKGPCSQADVEPRFFLHVYPVDSNDLLAQSRQRGYDNLDFSFAGHGFRSGERCLAIRELPRYAISRLETGQFTSGEDRIWEGSFAVGE